jgi:hypothetical protein
MMKRNWTWPAVAAAIVAFALVGAAPAHAQAQGQTTVSIDIPDIVILHYFSSVDVTLDANAMGSYLTGTPGGASTIDEGNASGAASLTGGNFQLDLGMSPSGLTGDPSAALLVLQNAWAVRAITVGGGSATTQLDVAVTGAALTSGGSSIAISTAAVDDGTSNGASITFPSTGLGNPTVGDVELTLDFSGATESGTHTGGEFQLTATNI